ncbi:MAG: hypothetical protein WD042_01700 [Phycisphaeraceae bacterium]
MMRVMLIGVMAFLVGGCSVFSGVSAPLVKIDAVRLVEQTEQGARVEVDLLLENPNDVAIPLKYTSYSVRVAPGGTYRYGDESNRTLPAKGTQMLTLPAAFATGGASLSGARFKVDGDMTYEPPGVLRKALTDSGIPLPSVGFSRAGQLQ